jgi:transporter, CPA2 family (2.A.37)
MERDRDHIPDVSFGAWV